MKLKKKILPENIIIGSMNKEGVDKADIVKKIKEIAETQMGSSIFTTACVIDDGNFWIYELHYKGDGKSRLFNELKTLQKKKELYLELNKNMMVPVIYGEEGAKTLNIEEKNKKVKNVKPKGLMEIVEKIVETETFPLLKIENKRKYQEIESESIKAGERLVKDLEEKREIYPKNIIIGYMEGNKKQDLITILKDYSNIFELKNTTTYQAIKYNNGFLYEMHEAGNGKGFLTNMLPVLDSEGRVILPVDNEKVVEVIKDKNQISTIKYSEKDTLEPDVTERKDKMTPLYKPNYLIYRLGLVSLILAILSVAISTVIKFVIINENKQLVYPKLTYETPYIASQKDQMRLFDHERITLMEFKNGEWNYNKTNTDEENIEIRDIENIEDINEESEELN